MLDPATALRDLERFLDLPCEAWGHDLADRGVELDCDGVAAGQAALRDALAAGGTHHDVLGRMGQAIASAALPAKRRLTALAVADVARAASLRRLRLALEQMGGAPPAAAAT